MTERNFKVEIRQWELALRRAATKKAQEKIRINLMEDLGMILVRTHTVQAYFRRPSKRRARKLRLVA
jgi:hypothetical protein